MVTTNLSAASVKTTIGSLEILAVVVAKQISANGTKMRMRAMSDYPEHERLQEIQAISQAEGEFIYWLESKGTHLMRYNDQIGWHKEPESITELLAAYHEIDLEKLEEEKREMLDKIRESNS
jgi:hypothetical protein